jgi:hypothetical protein
VPAAAVIPAPIAYIKVVAVKKLVVGLVRIGRGGLRPKGRSASLLWCRKICNWIVAGLNWSAASFGCSFTVRKLECSRQA